MESGSTGGIGRTEFVFVYDVRDANPNGDPAEGNRPRMDDYTGQNIVSDVRIKRTVRDYVDGKYGNVAGLQVFIKEHRKPNGQLLSKLDVVKVFLACIGGPFDYSRTKAEILRNYWDLRVFGALLDQVPVKKSGSSSGEETKPITVTGPVQMRFGRSIHKVEPELVIGTTVMKAEAKAKAGDGKSPEDKYQGTTTEYWKVPYSLIAVYGVVNNHVARETGLSRRDVGIFWEALWNGTADLNTRSKVGHAPRLLVVVEYATDYHTGDLDYLIRMYRKDGTEITARVDERGIGKSIRGPEEYYLDLSGLFNELEHARKAGKLRTVWVLKHPDLEVKGIPDWDEVRIIVTEYIDWNTGNLRDFGTAWGMGGNG